MKKKLIFFLGLKRNGTHAIINWFIKNIEKQYCDVGFLNDVNEKGLSFKTIEKVVSDNLITFLSYEELSTSEFDGIKHQTMQNVDIIEILILRDFKNSIASRIKYISEFNSDSVDIYDYFLNNEYYKDVWIEFANILLDEKQDRFFCIKYNSWVSDKKYRDNVLEKIFGIKNTDCGFFDVPSNAGGSSFDYLRYNKKAYKMKVLDRWKLYPEDQLLRNFVLSDKTILDIENKLFDK